MSTDPNDVSLEARPARLPRLMSIDALRGFDMFWIIGGDEDRTRAWQLVGHCPRASVSPSNSST